MKFKLDENVDTRLIPLVQKGGHDVDTIRGEGLAGADDHAIYDACVRDGRILVTLDLDFSNPMRFPPGPTEGIIIVRPVRPVLPQIQATIASTLPELKKRPLEGKLWIIEPGRIRSYDPNEGDEA